MHSCMHEGSFLMYKGKCLSKTKYQNQFEGGSWRGGPYPIFQPKFQFKFHNASLFSSNLNPIFLMCFGHKSQFQFVKSHFPASKICKFQDHFTPSGPEIRKKNLYMKTMAPFLREQWAISSSNGPWPYKTITEWNTREPNGARKGMFNRPLCWIVTMMHGPHGLQDPLQVYQ